MNFRFKKPVYFGDTIECRFTITQPDDRNRAKAEVVFKNQKETDHVGYWLPSPRKPVLLRSLDLPFQPITNASRSAFSRSAWVIGKPCAALS